MTVNDFIRIREKDWTRLQSLVQRQRGRASLSAGEVRELGMLYRAAISDLALAQRDYPGLPVTRFLNQLLTQAHNIIYQEDVTNGRAFAHFVSQRIPGAFAQAKRFTLVALLMFLVPALVGFQIARQNPSVAEPLGLVTERDALANQSLWTDIPIEARPYASTFIMTNNIRVVLLAFGGGILLGLFSTYVLAMNGLILGAVFGLTVHYGLGQELFEFVIAHGVLELSVIFISGGAGLRLGWAIIHPGYHTRRDALMVAAREAVPLIILAIPALVVAGLIEGFVSPSDAPVGLKLAVGVTSGALLYGYLLVTKRPSRR